MADFKFSTTTPSKIYFGTIEVQKIYWGTTEVWSNAAPSYWAPYIAQTSAVAGYEELIYVAQMATAADTSTPVFVHCVSGGGYYVTQLTDDSAFRAALTECVILGHTDMANLTSTGELEGEWACNFNNSTLFYVFVPDYTAGYDTYLTGYRGNAT